MIFALAAAAIRLVTSMRRRAARPAAADWRAPSHLRGMIGVTRVQHDIAPGARGDARQRACPTRRAPITATELSVGMSESRPCYLQNPPVLRHWRRAASARGGGVHRIGQAERHPLRAGPGDHRAVVGAERGRRNDQRGLRFGGDVL